MIKFFVRKWKCLMSKRFGWCCRCRRCLLVVEGAWENTDWVCKLHNQGLNFRHGKRSGLYSATIAQHPQGEARHRRAGGIAVGIGLHGHEYGVWGSQTWRGDDQAHQICCGYWGYVSWHCWYVWSTHQWASCWQGETVASPTSTSSGCCPENPWFLSFCSLNAMEIKHTKQWRSTYFPLTRASSSSSSSSSSHQCNLM